MKYLLFILLFPLISSAQQTTDILLNKDTVITTVTKIPATKTITSTVTSTIQYDSVSISRVVKPYIPPKIDTIAPPPVTPAKYEGFGSQAIGGSNSNVVYHVTNTNASGAGSLAAGIGSNKTIVFDVSGTIVGRFDLVKISYLTIDATGRDITIDNNNNGDGISFDGPNTHNCILKGVRVTNAGQDGINVVDGAHDILITNCTSYGNGDGNIDVAASSTGLTKNVTVQYCILGDNYGSGKMLITAQNVSVHHNLFYSTSASGEGAERNPFIHANYSPVGNPNCDFRNNLIYNWGRYGTGFGYKATVNVVKNYYSGSGSGAIDPAADPSGNGSNHAWYFVSGNVQSNRASINLNGGNHAEYVIADLYKVTTTDAIKAGHDVLANAGTTVKNGDELKVINAIKVQ